MQSIIRTYGKKTWIFVSVFLVAAISVLFLVVGFCVHDYGKAENALRFVDFGDGKNYKLASDTEKAIEELTALIETGEYEKYENIYTYDALALEYNIDDGLTQNGDKIFNIGFDKLVYKASKGNDSGSNIIFRYDEGLPERSVRCETVACSQLKNLTKEDFRCYMTESHRYGDDSDGVFCYVLFAPNDTTRFTDKIVTDHGNGSVSTEYIGMYKVDPTYSVVKEDVFNSGNKRYLYDTAPSGWGLNDKYSPINYLTVSIVYCSPDIEVIGSDSETWDKDALGV